MTAQNISESAARWYIRMRSAEPDDLIRSQFEAWVMSNPKHRDEYTSIAETMQDLSANDKLKAIADALEQERFLSRETRKHKLMKTAASLCIFLVVGLVSLFTVNQYDQWQSQPLLQIAKSNPVGQISKQTLEDGSQVTLSAKSEMQVTYYRNQRHVLLKHGEAIFEVVKDADRPFVVETDHAKVTVLGTKFAVNKLSKLVRVSVDHGRVKVESKSPQSTIILTNGQVAEITPNKTSVMVNRNASDAFVFQQGKLIFVGADVYEVADTLSRYRSKPLSAQGKANRNISAVINIKDSEQFLQGLSNIAPVKLEQNGSETQLISIE
jgi:transmembrane sensor